MLQCHHRPLPLCKGTPSEFHWVICPIFDCMQRFDALAEFRAHVEFAHMRQRPARCGDCGETEVHLFYTNEAILRKHRVRCHPESLRRDWARAYAARREWVFDDEIRGGDLKAYKKARMESEGSDAGGDEIEPLPRRKRQRCGGDEEEEEEVVLLDDAHRARRRLVVQNVPPGGIFDKKYLNGYEEGARKARKRKFKRNPYHSPDPYAALDGCAPSLPSADELEELERCAGDEEALRLAKLRHAEEKDRRRREAVRIEARRKVAQMEASSSSPNGYRHYSSSPSSISYSPSSGDECDECDDGERLSPPPRRYYTHPNHEVWDLPDLDSEYEVVDGTRLVKKTANGFREEEEEEEDDGPSFASFDEDDYQFRMSSGDEEEDMQEGIDIIDDDDDDDGDA